MTMPEVERQFYLGRAGIHLWYARKTLPGAAPSPEFAFPEHDAPELEFAAIAPPLASARSSVPQRKIDGVGKDRIAGIQALMAGNAPETADIPVPEKTQETPVVAGPEVTAEASSDKKLEAVEGSPSEIRAHLGFWLSERLVLISGVSDQASTRLQDTLAENILTAVGETRIEKGHELRWPVFGNLRVPGNSADNFRDTLHSLVNNFGARKLVLLGVLAKESPSERAVRLDSVLGDAAVDFPYTLAELAAVPAHKRDLWQRLKSIVGG
jgi:hypothetical protein